MNCVEPNNYFAQTYAYMSTMSALTSLSVSNWKVALVCACPVPEVMLTIPSILSISHPVSPTASLQPLAFLYIRPAVCDLRLRVFWLSLDRVSIAKCSCIFLRVAASSEWNQLPMFILCLNSFSSFKKRLKIHYFLLTFKHLDT